MAIQLPRRLRHLLIRAPVLEVRELLEPEERAELVHGAYPPGAALHDAHDFDDAQDGGDPSGAVRCGGGVGRVLEDPREVVVAEFAVGAAVDAVRPQEISIWCRRCCGYTYPPNSRVFGFGSTITSHARFTAGPKSASVSFSKSVVWNRLAKRSSVHLMSFCAVVWCHCHGHQCMHSILTRDEGRRKNDVRGTKD